MPPEIIPETQGQQASSPAVPREEGIGKWIASVLLLGAGLMLGFAQAFLKYGLDPSNPQKVGALIGGTLGPLIFASLGVGLYYAFRKSRRTARRVFFYVAVWTFVLSLLGFVGAFSRQRTAKDTAGQVLREAVGKSAPQADTDPEFRRVIQEFVQDVTAHNQEYLRQAERFHTPEIELLYQPKSFSSRQLVQEILRQLRDMMAFEAQYASLEPLLARMRARIEAAGWPEEKKRNFLAGFSETSGRQEALRKSLYAKEKLWLEATIDLYEFVLANFHLISIQGEDIFVAGDEPTQVFNTKLSRATSLRGEFLRAQENFQHLQKTTLGEFGLAPEDFGHPEP